MKPKGVVFRVEWKRIGPTPMQDEWVSVNKLFATPQKAIIEKKTLGILTTRISAVLVE